MDARTDGRAAPMERELAALRETVARCEPEP